ncbi:MAG: hypothetical protein U0168_14955 [Nannocystaceae bacterium]
MTLVEPVAADPGRARWIAIGVALAAALVLAVGFAGWSAGWLAGTRAQQEQAGYGVVPGEPSATPQPEAGGVPDAAGRACDRIGDRDGAAAGDARGRDGVGARDAAGHRDATVGGEQGRRRGSRPPTASRPRPAPAEPVAPAASSSLEAEMALLGRASASRRAGDREAALASLQRHAREFLDGQLAPERELQRALVLCELGRRDEARAIARGFAQRFATSPLRSKAAAVCAQEATP